MILQITREEIQAATTRYLERGGQIQQIDKVVGEPIFGDDLILTEDVLEMIEAVSYTHLTLPTILLV